MMIIKHLCAGIKPDGDEKTLEIFSLTLRTIIMEADMKSAVSIINILYPMIINGLKPNAPVKVKEQCLDISDQMFKQFGLIILKQNLINKDELKNAIIAQLTGAESTLRKKACYALGSFAVVLNKQQIGELS